MLFQKETKIRDMANQPVTLQHTINTDFLPYGLEMPYRIIAENKLVQVEKYDSTPTLTSTSTYSYDGFGRRVKKSVDGTVTFYVYDNEDVRFETDELGNIIAEYTHGSWIDEPLAMRRNGANYYYHVNGLGSITALTDSSKTVVQTYTYDSFGQIISQTGTITNPYTYTAREYDEKTGMYYYRARYYDAKMGRFISEYPILKPLNSITLGLGQPVNQNIWMLSFLLTKSQCLHPYVYVTNNPIMYSDDLGRGLIDCLLCGIYAAGCAESEF